MLFPHLSKTPWARSPPLAIFYFIMIPVTVSPALVYLNHDFYLQGNSFKMELIYVTLFLAAILGTLFIFRTSLAKGKAKNNFKTISKEGLKTSYSKDEVLLHNKKDDCWIIVKDKVYDVTPYVEEHPGGDAILKHAGGDSTKGFYGPQHASRVFDMVDEFYIGDLMP